MFPGVTDIIARLIVILTCLPIHEAAHAFAAEKMGDDTARYNRRVSMNPFDHIDPVGALMILLVGFGWAKAVPFNPNNFRNRRGGTVVTALAGPLANVGLAGVCLIVYKVLRGFAIVTPGPDWMFSGILQVLWMMVSVNLSLAVFNLLPLPPLDGWRIASVLLPPRIVWQIQGYEQMLVLPIMILVWMDLFDAPIYFLTNFLYRILSFLTGFIDIPFRMLL